MSGFFATYKMDLLTSQKKTHTHAENFLNMQVIALQLIL